LKYLAARLKLSNSECAGIELYRQGMFQDSLQSMLAPMCFVTSSFQVREVNARPMSMPAPTLQNFLPWSVNAITPQVSFC